MEKTGSLFSQLRQSTVYKAVLISVCILWALPLAVYTYNGAQMRLSGDDYCYSGVLQVYGFWRMQVESYTRLHDYNGNRYALTLFSALAGIFGPKANGWLPGLALWTWVLGCSTALFLGCKSLGSRIMPLEALALAGQAAALSLAQTPSLPQSLYWRSAMLAYLAPLVALSLLASLAAWHSLQARADARRLLAVFLLAVLAGGFSEAGAVLLLASSGLAVVASGWSVYWARSQGRNPRLTQAFFACAASLAGAFAALLLLTLSPMVQLANQSLPERAGPVTLGRMMAHNAGVFLYTGLKDQGLAWLVSLLVPAGIAFLWGQETAGPRPSLPRLFWRAAAVTAIGLALVLVCMAPNAYVQYSAPELRTMILPQFVWVVTLMALGALSGLGAAEAARSFHMGGALPGLTVLAVITLSSCYSLLPARQEVAQTTRYQRWARFWDERDETIRLAKAAGEVEIEVILLDHIIPDVAELSPDPDFWYNNCAEMVYGMNSITANQPGWDE